MARSHLEHFAHHGEDHALIVATIVATYARRYSIPVDTSGVVDEDDLNAAGLSTSIQSPRKPKAGTYGPVERWLKQYPLAQNRFAESIICVLASVGLAVWHRPNGAIISSPNSTIPARDHTKHRFGQDLEAGAQWTSNGSSRRSAGNREKFPSVEHSVSPCSIANAAKWASGTKFACTPGSASSSLNISA